MTEKKVYNEVIKGEILEEVIKGKIFEKVIKGKICEKVIKGEIFEKVTVGVPKSWADVRNVGLASQSPPLVKVSHKVVEADLPRVPGQY